MKEAEEDIYLTSQIEELQKEAQIKELQKKVREAEGELSIIKGIGQNSPEMKELKENNQKLKKQVEFLQFTCREAATKIKKLEEQIESLKNSLTEMRKGGM